MAPMVHGLEAEYHQEINFVYLDIDDSRNDRFKQQLGFRYQPHFFLLDGDGEVLNVWVGRVSEEDFRAAFESALTLQENQNN
jgi:thioredoxin-like negative regulator of GroEL